MRTPLLLAENILAIFSDTDSQFIHIHNGYNSKDLLLGNEKSSVSTNVSTYALFWLFLILNNLIIKIKINHPILNLPQLIQDLIEISTYPVLLSSVHETFKLLFKQKTDMQKQYITNLQ